MQEMIGRCRARNKSLFAEVTQLRSELDTERWKMQNQLSVQHNELQEEADKFVKEELKKAKHEYMLETKK